MRSAGVFSALTLFWSSTFACDSFAQITMKKRKKYGRLNAKNMKRKAYIITGNTCQIFWRNIINLQYSFRVAFFLFCSFTFVASEVLFFPHSSSHSFKSLLKRQFHQLVRTICAWIQPMWHLTCSTFISHIHSWKYADQKLTRQYIFKSILFAVFRKDFFFERFDQLAWM